MIIYWSMFVINAFFGYISHKMHLNVIINNFKENRSRKFIALIPMLYIIFWTGMRSGFVDTFAYIQTFESIPTGGINSVMYYMKNVEKDQLFYFLSALFKNYISTNYHWWLLLIAAISGLCIYRILQKYSDNYHFSIFLFLSMAIFIWMMNGIRQFIAISVLFGFSDWLVANKKFNYMLLIIIMAFIHSSCIFLLPICFFVNEDPWNKKMLFIILVMILLVIFSEQSTSLFVSTIGSDYADTFNDSGGSSLIRTFVIAIPTILAFWKRKKIEIRDNPYINLCVNMSVFCTCFYLFASFTNGILVGRFPMYFNVYNLILLPWILRYCFNKEERLLIYVVCIVCYLAYFYYQAKIAGNYYYVSDFTGLIR